MGKVDKKSISKEVPKEVPKKNDYKNLIHSPRDDLYHVPGCGVFNWDLTYCTCGNGIGIRK